MATENLYDVDFTAKTGASPALQSYCFKAMLPQTTVKLLVRALDAQGRSLGTGHLFIYAQGSVNNDWHTFRDIYVATADAGSLRAVLDSATPPANLAAIEVIQTFGGYAFFTTGADPANANNVLTAMQTAPLTTLLVGGEILGYASYIRPLGQNYGHPGVYAKILGQIFASSSSPTWNLGTPLVVQGPTPSEQNGLMLVPPGRDNRLLCHCRFEAANWAAHYKVNIEVAFRLARVGYPSVVPQYDTEEDVWQILPQIPTDGTKLIRTLDAPPPGKYIVKARLSKVGANFDLVYGANPNVFELVHEVY